MGLTGLRCSCTANRLGRLICMVKLLEMNNMMEGLLGELAWRLD